MKHNYIKIAPLFFLILVVLGCEKERLNKDKEIIVGTWNWEYSSVLDYCAGYAQIIEYTPLTDGENYQLVFLKKGIIRFQQNGNLLREHNIQFHYFKVKDGIVDSNREIDVVINLDGNPEDKFYMRGTQKEMMVVDFPYETTKDCNTYPYNFFRKE